MVDFNDYDEELDGHADAGPPSKRQRSGQSKPQQQQPQQRLFIKQVIINGFKTYKDQTPLPVDFHMGSNIVVGFNGSGKSNFFNAILFVISDEFGALTQQTRKSLLHEGAGQAVTTAYVELVFDNTCRKLPIERDEVRLRRVITPDTDYYTIDGKRCQTKQDMFNLLESAGFARSNPYYVVKQGKVQELTVMTDERRLKLMQEVSGVAIYDERKAASQKKIAEIDQRYAESGEKMVQMQQRIDELAKDQEDLRKFQQADKEMRAIRYVDCCMKVTKCQRQIEEISTELNGLEMGISESITRGLLGSGESEEKDDGDRDSPEGSENDDDDENTNSDVKSEMEKLHKDPSYINKIKLGVSLRGFTPQQQLEKLESKKDDLHQRITELRSDLSRLEIQQKEYKKEYSALEDMLEQAKLQTKKCREEQESQSMVAKETKVQLEEQKLNKDKIWETVYGKTNQNSSNIDNDDDFNSSVLDDSQSLIKLVEVAERDVDVLESDLRTKRTAKMQLEQKQTRGQQYSSIAERNKALKTEIHNAEKSVKDANDDIDRIKLEVAKFEMEVLETNKKRDDITKKMISMDRNHMQPRLEQLEVLEKEIYGLKIKSTDYKRNDQHLNLELKKLMEESYYRSYEERIAQLMPPNMWNVVRKMDQWTTPESLESYPWPEVSRGYYGPLIRNIKVDDSYRVAVESALGMQLYNLLVQSDGIASEILTTVKNKNLGKVECIPLNKYPKFSSMKRRNDYPDSTNVDNCIPMIDVIECEDWVKPVVSRICGNWIICENLNVCSKIARSGKWECVTLQGDKEQSSGVITGGKMDKRRFKKLETEANRREILSLKDRLDSKRAKIQDDIRGLEEEQNSKNQQRQHLIQKIQDDRITKEKSSDQVSNLNTQLENLNFQSERKRRELRELENRVLELTEEIKSKTNEINSKTCGGLTDSEIQELKLLNSDVIPKLETNTKQKRSNLDELKTKKDQSLKEITKLDNLIRDLESQVADANEKINLNCAERLQERQDKERQISEKMQEISLQLAENQVDNETGNVIPIEETAQYKKTLEYNYSCSLFNKVESKIEFLENEIENLESKKQDLRFRKTQFQQELQVAEKEKRSYTTYNKDEIRELFEMSEKERKRRYMAKQREHKNFEGVNRKALEQYQRFYDGVKDLETQQGEMKEARRSLVEWIETVDSQKQQTLESTITKIGAHFEDCFRALVRGGEGRFKWVKGNETEEGAATGAVSGTGADDDGDGGVSGKNTGNKSKGNNKKAAVGSKVTAAAAVTTTDSLDGNKDSNANNTSDNLSKLLTGIRIEVRFTHGAVGPTNNNGNDSKNKNNSKPTTAFVPMNQLSGGQKTVVALALLFAIQRLEPAPFYLFDEIDANLDTMYRASVAALIAKESKSGQMILTTFRPELVENADRFYRVYMMNRTSRIDCVSKEECKSAIAAQTAAEGLDN